ncbi:hypothetical protein B0H16DRAFT_1462653 [Mycena metata]|uniref:Uncharacterized protein n=1 Tax=Mycena metata TaxID=1033252 RepID=A0AAD7N594_9AGAR|nr:hypothetical protein B0H16DRAFT_1462653 [Mycena metata]
MKAAPPLPLAQQERVLTNDHTASKTCAPVCARGLSEMAVTVVEAEAEALLKEASPRSSQNENQDLYMRLAARKTKTRGRTQQREMHGRTQTQSLATSGQERARTCTKRAHLRGKRGPLRTQAPNPTLPTKRAGMRLRYRKTFSSARGQRHTSSRTKVASSLLPKTPKKAPARWGTNGSTPTQAAKPPSAHGYEETGEYAPIGPRRALHTQKSGLGICNGWMILIWKPAGFGSTN